MSYFKNFKYMTDTTTKAQYGRAAIWTLILLRNKELTTKKQVKCSFL
jgi:hypothetical protein